MKYVCGATIELGDKVIYRRNGEDLICGVIGFKDEFVCIWSEVVDDKLGKVTWAKAVSHLEIVKA